MEDCGVLTLTKKRGKEMSAGLSKRQIYDKLRYLKKKFPEKSYLVLRASNGEVAFVTKEWHDFCHKKKGE